MKCFIDECEYNCGFYCSAPIEHYIKCLQENQKKDIEDAESISKKLGMTAEQTHDYFAMVEMY